MTTILESAAGFLLAMLIRPLIGLALAKFSEHEAGGSMFDKYVGML